MPESSAIVTSPVASCAARALISALAAKLSPSSGGISNPAGNGFSSTVGSSSSISANLCRLPVARVSTNFLIAPLAGIRLRCSLRDDSRDPLLHLPQTGDAALREGQQLVQRSA